MSQDNSPLRIYRRTSEIRQRREFQSSHISFAVVNDNVLSYLRYIPGCPKSGVYLVTVNLGTDDSTDDYLVDVNGKSFTHGVVVLDTQQSGRAETVVNLKAFKLNVGQAVVIRLTERQRDEL